MQKCGIGKVNAAVGASEMIAAFHPDLVISTGVAGGADTSLEVCEVVVSTACCYHDVYCGDECAMGQVLGMPERFESDKTITGLNDNVSSLQEESSKKTETINDQDAQLNTAWFAFGTKRELKDQRIIDGSKVLQSNFNKSYFTKIDIRVQKEIKLYSKSAKILTMHPSSSYTLQRDANKQYVLRISNPQIFWSTSKYLVIQVKK